MKYLIRICAMAFMVSTLWPAYATAKDNGCPFTRISPVPEGKAVIYLYKVGYGRDVHPISVNGEIVTTLQKPGYYPLVVAPGKYEIFVSMAGFFNTPITTINAEAGREYFLELLTRFSAAFKEVPENNALKDLKRTRFELPVKVYERNFPTVEGLHEDPVLKAIMANYSQAMKHIVYFLASTNPTSTNYKTSASLDLVFSGGTISLRYGGINSVKTYMNYRQAGLALSCNPPILR